MLQGLVGKNEIVLQHKVPTTVYFICDIYILYMGRKGSFTYMYMYNYSIRLLQLIIIVLKEMFKLVKI